MHTEIKVVNNQEYICLMTNDIKEGDDIIFTRLNKDKSKTHTIHNINYANKTANFIKYTSYNSFGFTKFRSMTNLSKLYGKCLIIELDTLFAKIVGKGVLLN